MVGERSEGGGGGREVARMPQNFEYLSLFLLFAS